MGQPRISDAALLARARRRLRRRVEHALMPAALLEGRRLLRREARDGRLARRVRRRLGLTRASQLRGGTPVCSLQCGLGASALLRERRLPPRARERLRLVGRGRRRQPLRRRAASVAMPSCAPRLGSGRRRAQLVLRLRRVRVRVRARA